MVLSDEDIKFIKFSKDCIDRGRYSDTTKLTEVYNRCFSDRPRFRPIKNTNCGQCIKGCLFGGAREGPSEYEMI